MRTKVFAWLAPVVSVALFALVPSCASEHDPAPSAGVSGEASRPAEARSELASLQAQFPSVALTSPALGAEAGVVRVSQPSHADGEVEVTEVASKTVLRFKLRGAPSRARVDVDGLSVFSGAGIVHRVHDAGIEDYVSFPSRPAREEAVYDLDVSQVAGLRVVGRTLEALDAGGAPRLRMAPPYVVDARGQRIEATVALEGCAFDSSPHAPWRRPVTPPNARHCALRIGWTGVTYPALLDPSWTGGGSGFARDQHTAVSLASGLVLLMYGQSCGGGCLPSNATELYDPATKTFASLGASLPDRGSDRPAVQLGNGKVLIHGGGGQLFDPTTITFDPIGPMTAVRGAASLTLLGNGKVLFAGGSGATAELYVPGTSTFVATPPMTSARTNPAAAMLPSGKVLIVGGETATAEIYDPAAGANGSFTATGSMSTARTGHFAVTLPSGKVLVGGGGLASAEIFDPATGKFSPTGSMLEPRAEVQATLMPSGSVYVTGGFVPIPVPPAFSFATALVERFDPTTGTFKSAPVMTVARGYHRATLVGGGALLVTGGRSRTDSPGRSTPIAEQLSVSSPGAACLANDDCSFGICDRGVCCATACNSTCNACVPGSGACLPVRSSDDPDTCTGTSTCDAAGTCKKKNGQACGAGPDCASGFCTDGVCCNAACDGVCEACDGLVKGRCEVVAGKARGARPCANDGTTCGGACDGVQRNVCLFPTAQTGCGTTCKDGIRTAGVCDGRGACKNQPPQPCPGNYACADESACKVACANDGDCGRLYACQGGACTPAAKCDGEHSILGSDGRTATDCTPYRCDPQNRCRTSCSDVDQCASPFLCSAEGQCVAPPTPSSGCASTAAPSGASGTAGSSWLGALGFFLCIAFARRGRRAPACERGRAPANLSGQRWI